MTREDRSAKRRQAAGEEPASEVPEADAVEQRAPAGDDDAGSGWDAPSGDSFDQAAEADVVEQARDAGSDEDERR